MEILLELSIRQQILIVLLDLFRSTHQLQFEGEHEIMSWLGELPDLCQELNGLPNRILPERLIQIGNLHGRRDEDDQSLQVVNQHTSFSLSSTMKVFIDPRPIVAVDMQEV